MGKCGFVYVDRIVQEKIMEEIKLPGIDAKALHEALERDIQQCIEQVTEAVNTSRAGAVIDDSEEPVRIATAKLRQKIFQKALQMKTDAAEAAFSPSEKDKGKK